MRTWARPCVLALVMAASMTGCKADTAVLGLEAITPETLDAHLRFLSSDLLEGRAPGTPGAGLAASYVALQFRLAGLTPAIGDSSYFQPVSLIAETPTAQLSFRAPGGAAFSPEQGSEFVAWSHAATAEDSAGAAGTDVGLVFVGYGITAPEYEWDDFKNVDVRGKFLLILAGDPGPYLASRFRGDTATFYGLPEYKLAEAARRGALGAILVHAADLPYGWNAIKSVRAGEQVRLDVEPDATAPRFAGWLVQEAAEQVVSMASLDFETLLESARSEEFRPINTGMMVSARVRNEVRRFSDVNVIGLLPGSHPQLEREVVVFSAHYDHLGIGEPVDFDSIYNGAYDNASGVALLLCLADAFARLPQRPSRSILFLALTAEEPGLLGSKAYLREPLVPLDRTVADINIDGVNLWGRTEDVVAFGAELSTLGSVARRAAQASGLALKSDRSPRLGYLYRSDQFSFLKAGVPSVQIGHGLGFIGQMPGWGEQVLSRYNATMYHQPSDEYRADFDLRGAVQQGRVAFRIGLSVANQDERPTWRAGVRAAYLDGGH